MKSSLTLDYMHSSDDDFGSLQAVVQTERYRGRGAMWVQWQDVLKFADSLSAFPIGPDAPVEAAWGYERLQGDDLIIGIEIRPSGGRGELQVRVEIADDIEPWHRLRTGFTTNYQAMQEFGVALNQVMKKEAEKAVLLGD